MQKININDNRDKINNYCPVCGTKNIGLDSDNKMELNECNHLVFIGTSDSDPEYDKEKIYEGWDSSSELSIFEYLEKKLDNTYTCFISYQSAPAMLEGYIIYKLNQS